MKNIAFTLICFILLSGCNQDNSKTISQDKPAKVEGQNSSLRIENFDCALFFKKGDYSTLCFVDTALLEHGGAGCIFDFKTKGDKQNEDLKLQFVDKNSTSLAEMHYNLNRNNYKKGIITEISGVGDAAFFDVHGTDLKSLSRSNKDLHVRYKNITFVLMAEYLSATEAPCFYANEALITFANMIIENL